MTLSRRLASVLLFLLPAAAAGKPTIVGYHIGDTDKTVIVDPLRKRMAPLKACGYDVIEKKVEKPEDIVFGKDKASPALIWISGHGGILRGGEVLPSDDVSTGDALAPIVKGKEGFHLMKSRDGGIAFDDDRLVTRLSDQFREPQLFLQSCYAGACPSRPGVGVGCSSCPTKLTYTFDQTADVLVELLCSGVGDCKEWNRADRDGNGVVSPTELERYLAARIGTQTNTVWVPADRHDAVRSDCEKKSGTFSAERVELARVKLEYDTVEGGVKKANRDEVSIQLFLKRYGFPNSPKGRDFKGKRLVSFTDEYHLLEEDGVSSLEHLAEDVARVRTWLTAHAADFRTGPERTPVRNLSVEVRAGYKIQCRFERRPHRKDRENLTDEQPQFPSLSLRSATCRREKALRRKSGLQLREALDPAH